MSHEIDLSKYQIRTDLAIESISETKEQKQENYGDIKVSSVVLNKDEADLIGKKEGMYITIEFDDVTDFNNKEKVKDVFIKKMEEMLTYLKIDKEQTCLIIGLGNDKSTPDSLGPLVIDNILVTGHLFKIGQVEDGFRCVSAIAPGVMGQTGIETSDLIKSIVRTEKPSFLIVVDALASGSVDRLNKTIQITDAGINPGSGIGNSRKEISKEVMNIPVIAIGVPTVVDAVTIVSDTINYMYKKFTYTKERINSPSFKLSFGNSNYLKKNINVSKETKENLFGLVGKLNDDELRGLVYEVLSPIGYNLMVTPKEVDFIMEKLGDIIGNGLNNVLHDKV